MTLRISLLFLAAIAFLTMVFGFIPSVLAQITEESPRAASSFPSAGLFVALIIASIVFTLVLKFITERRTQAGSLPEAESPPRSTQYWDLKSLVISDTPSNGQDLAYVSNLSTVSEAKSVASELGILVTGESENVRPEVISSKFLPHTIKPSEDGALTKLISDALQESQQESQSTPETEQSRSGIGILLALNDKVYIGTSGSVVALRISDGKFSDISGSQGEVKMHKLIKGQIIALGSPEFAKKDLQEFLSPILGEFQVTLSRIMGESYELDAIRTGLQVRRNEYPKMSLIILS